MGDRLEFVDAAGRESVCEIPAGTVLLGARNGLVYVSSDANVAGLRVVDTAKGRRIEPVRAGGTVVVAGVELFCKDLAPGDVIAIDGVRATWRPEASGKDRGRTLPIGGSSTVGALRSVPTADRAAVRPTAPRTAASPLEPNRPIASRRRSAAATPKVLLLSMVSLAVLFVVVGLRFLDSQVGKHGPDELMAFARIQFDSGQFERTLTTLAEAEQKAEADPRITTAVAELRERVRLAQRHLQRTAALERARTALEALRSFADRYGQDPMQRPAARAIVRQCDGFREEHADSLRGFADGDALLAEVTGLRGRAEPKAELGTDDTAADAIFAARTHLRFVVREYKAAVAAMEAFVAGHPQDEGARRELQQLRSEAGEWLRGQRASLERSVSRGDHDGARQRLAQLERHALLPEFEAEFAAVRDALAQRPVDPPR